MSEHMAEAEAARYREVAEAAAALLRVHNSPRHMGRSMTCHLRAVQEAEVRLSRALAAVGYRPAQRPVCWDSTPRWPRLVEPDAGERAP